MQLASMVVTRDMKRSLYYAYRGCHFISKYWGGCALDKTLHHSADSDMVMADGI